MTYGTASYAANAFGHFISFITDPLGVDNQARRMSAFNFCDPFDHILPVADNAISALDRQHLWGMYIGIAAAGAVVVEAAAPQRVRIGAHGLLHGAGKTPIGRGF